MFIYFHKCTNKFEKGSSINLIGVLTDFYLIEIPYTCIRIVLSDEI